MALSVLFNIVVSPLSWVMMRGDTLTAGISRISRALFIQHLYEYRMRGDLFPTGLRKGNLRKNSARGNKSGGRGHY